MFHIRVDDNIKEQASTASATVETAASRQAVLMGAADYAESFMRCSGLKSLKSQLLQILIDRIEEGFKCVMRTVPLPVPTSRFSFGWPRLLPKECFTARRNDPLPGGRSTGALAPILFACAAAFALLPAHFSPWSFPNQN